MVHPWFGDLLRPFAIICGQMSLQVIYFFVIHKQSQSFCSLFSYSVLSLLILRFWAFWSNLQVQPGCSTVFSLSRVSGTLCSFFPGFFPTQGREATMGYSSRLCPCPVGPSLPPSSLLVVRSGGNFKLVVSGRGLPCLHCQCPFGGGVGGLLHFSSSLSVSTFLIRSHLHSCGFSPNLRGPRFTHPVLRWPRISLVDGDPPPLPSPRFCWWERRSWCPGFLRVLQFSVPFRLF